MPLRWSRQHMVRVALALVVLLIWASVIYKLILDYGDDGNPLRPGARLIVSE
jgi:hypothetical protein